MKVIFMGTPDFSVPVLDALMQAGHDICAVYCQPPRRAGRGKKERLTPVHARAEALGLTVRHPISLRNADAQAEFADLNADIAVVVAYGLILPQPILDAPTYGCLNIHASLLPRWRGAAPIHRAIMAGDAETGICIMQMEAGLDTGPVMLHESIPISDTETTGDLHDRLSKMGAGLIVKALADLPNLTPVVQSANGVTYANKIDKSEAQINWTKPAVDVDRLIRGLSPFPGAWTTLHGKRLKVLRSRVVEKNGMPGTVASGLTVCCGTGAIELLDVQFEGRSRQSQKEFLNGTQILPDTVLGEN
ncbi:methionyl-tRNA formyltransferase [Parasulfitobacter algicola]|uniref:Methionyl-tRNA formyltransferase n=1 Tax=Parasulfitobacter algicola TaxID=2614809 RepID=A0ABX2IPM7_9RHOB|nr:methionyl-tRNA formyltransferase [Sulfitobacter algicola]NSX53951.1 methionyl-tRNA formyltransferase [Sulfitobacter algicola]